MKISNHKLIAEAGEAAIPFISSPNQGGVIVPQYLVIHYTAGSSASSSIEWFKNPAAKASANLVIGMDGSITQMVAFNKRAFHAGVSRWNGLVGMNNFSIGIELDNPGRMRRVGDKWRSGFGREYPADMVMIATHKHQEEPSGWHIYTEAQLEACVKVSLLLVQQYGLLDILGHEDISPFRKEDPGPAFPMESFKSKVLGRSDDVADVFKVNTDDTNMRTGPGTDFAVMGKLKKGVKVEFIKSNRNWYFVYVSTATSALREKEGWIHSSLLTKV